MKSFHLLWGEEIDDSLKKSFTAYKEWKVLGFDERKKYLMRVRDILLEKKSSLAKLITSEMGKPFREALAEIDKCALVCNYYAENAEEFLKNEHIKTEAKESFVSFEPLGPVMAVMPWNFPFWQVFRFAAPALMAGNVCLLKHASNVPQCGLRIQAIFEEAQCPENIFITLMINASQAQSVVRDQRVKAVTLTGSEKAGGSVAMQAGRYIKKSVLELGGTDAFIVLKDADIELAAKAALKSRMNNSGQTCIAAKRMIVEAPVYEKFLGLIKEGIEKLVVGDPMDEKTDIGPMAKAELIDDLEAQIKRSVKKGAKKIIEGGRIKGSGNHYSPVLLTEVTKGMPAFDEELFGPVAVVINAENAEDALKIANNTDFGLGAAIWTSDMELAARYSRELEAGFVAVNDIVRSDPRLPFGGTKNSGYGRELSHYGIKEFTNIKTIVVK